MVLLIPHSKVPFLGEIVPTASSEVFECPTRQVPADLLRAARKLSPPDCTLAPCIVVALAAESSPAPGIQVFQRCLGVCHIKMFL